MSEAIAVNLSNIGSGAALELFNHNLERVMANIKDINTDAEKARSITLKVTFLPHGDRSGMQTVIECNSKLASVPAFKAGTMFILKNKEGALQAYSHDIRQEMLFSEPEPEPVVDESPANVLSMTKQA